MKKYVISSTTFSTLKEAEEQLNEWNDNDTLDKMAIVYKVKAEYSPVLKLLKIK